MAIQNNTTEDMHIYGKPGILWIIATPIILVNINNGNVKTPLGMLLIVILLGLAGGMTAWMNQVPHITVTSTGITIRHIFGSKEVKFADMASWGSSLGTLYLRRKNGEKVTAGMFIYVNQTDRQRLFAVLQERGIPPAEDK